jgi:chaperonin GroES
LETRSTPLSLPFTDGNDNAWGLTLCQPFIFGILLAVTLVVEPTSRALQKTTIQTFKQITKKTIIMNIKPLADRVLVLHAPAEEKIGGIIIPDTAKEKPLHGIVKAAGHGTKDEEMILKEGDEVLYGKYSGTEIELEGTKYLILRQSDVLAIIEK